MKKIWLAADASVTPEGWEREESAEHAYYAIGGGQVEAISIPYRLVRNQPSGLKLLEWLENSAQSNNIQNIPIISFRIEDGPIKRQMIETLGRITKTLYGGEDNAS